jgi:hypothetical protein
METSTPNPTQKVFSRYIFFLVSIVIIAGLHMLGLYFRLYWQLSWYDMIVHLLLAGWIGALCVLFLTSTFTIKKSNVFIISFMTVVLISILWEIFEVYTGSTFVTYPQYIPDTIGDLVADIIGSLLGIFFAVKHSIYGTKN